MSQPGLQIHISRSKTISFGSFRKLEEISSAEVERERSVWVDMGEAVIGRGKQSF